MSERASATLRVRHDCRVRPRRLRSLRDQCTTAELGHGRSVAIAENEQLQHRLRKQIQTPAGRAALRERTIIEHKLAHISQRQGTHARYVGIRKNTFDPRRASAIQNLETLHRSEVESMNAVSNCSPF